jgi:hypothetical protein
VRYRAATHSQARDPKRWPSSVDASTLLLSLEALARWREHLALSREEEAVEARRFREVPELAVGLGMRRGLH